MPLIFEELGLCRTYTQCDTVVASLGYILLHYVLSNIHMYLQNTSTEYFGTIKLHYLRRVCTAFAFIRFIRGTLEATTIIYAPIKIEK